MASTSKPPPLTAYLLRGLPILVAIAALVMVMLQSLRMAELDARLSAPAPEVAATRVPALEADRPPTAEPAPDATGPALEALTKEIAALSRRIDGIERRESRRHPATRPAVEPVVVEEDVAALREDVDALLTGEALDSDESREKISALLEEHTEKRRATWRKMRDEMHKHWLDGVADEIELSDEQRQVVDELYDGHNATRRALWGKMRANAIVYADFRAELDASKERMMAELQKLLSAAQFEAYKAKDEERNAGGHH